MTREIIHKVDAAGRTRKYVVGLCAICNKPHMVLNFKLREGKPLKHKECYITQHNHNNHLRGVFRRTEDTLCSTVYGSYVRSAKKRELTWDLTKQQFKALTQLPCTYCGILPEATHATEKLYNTNLFRYNGIDRVDNNKGYEISNCVPCCSICNFAKRDLDYPTWLAYVRRLTEFNILKEEKK